MIYLFPSMMTKQDAAKIPTVKPEDGTHVQPFSAQSGVVVGSKIPQRSNVLEDKVDVILQKLQGTIKRGRDPKKYVKYSDNKNVLGFSSNIFCFLV